MLELHKYLLHFLFCGDLALTLLQCPCCCHDDLDRFSCLSLLLLRVGEVSATDNVPLPSVYFETEKAEVSGRGLHVAVSLQ